MATLIKLLKRYWFPLGAFLLTFSFLAWLLQPRPRESYSFTTPEYYHLWDHFFPRSKTISSSGRYLCFESQDEDGHAFIHLFDIHTKAWLFKDRCDYDRIQSQPMFTSNDELIYSAFGAPDKVQLSCWKPGEAKPRMIYEYVYPIVHSEPAGPPFNWNQEIKPQSPNDSPFEGMMGFNFAELFDRTLSPDGLTWLVIVKQERSIYLDFIDSRTGKRNARLDFPPIELQKKAVRGVNVAFDPQSKYLLLRLRPELTENEKDDSKTWKMPTTLYWFEVASGKLMQSKTIRTELLPNGRLLWMDLKQLTFLGHKERLPVLQILNLDEGFKQIAMTDTYRDVLEETWPRGAIDSDHSLLRTLTFLGDSTDLDSLLMMYASEHLLSSQHSNAQGVPRLPGCSIACRDIRTGQLLFTRVYEFDRNSNEMHRDSGVGDVIPYALPGPVFVLMHHNAAPDWVHKPESWRYKLANWIPSLKYQQTSTFRIYDPHTGKQQGELVVPQDNALARLSTDKRSFSILGGTGYNEYQCLVFDYPFHKPWLIIFSWSAGVALTLLLLQTAMRSFARFASRVPKQRAGN